MLDFCPVERDINAYQKQIDAEEAYQDAVNERIGELYQIILDTGELFDDRGREIPFQDIFNEMLLNNDDDLCDLMLEAIKDPSTYGPQFFDKIQYLLVDTDGYLEPYAVAHLEKERRWYEEP